MQELDFVAWNSATFALTLDLSQVAAIFSSLATDVLRMQVKNYPTDTIPLYEWVTGATSMQGTASFNATALTAAFTAPQSGVAALVGVKYYDIRVEVAGVGEVPLAFGKINFREGVTSSTSGPNAVAGANIPDTVFCIFSQGLSSPYVLPVNMANIDLILAAVQNYVAACAASAAAAGTSATASAASLAAIPSAEASAVVAIQSTQATAIATLIAAAATYQNFTQANFIAWLDALPTVLPSAAGQYYWNLGAAGAVFARS